MIVSMDRGMSKAYTTNWNGRILDLICTIIIIIIDIIYNNNYYYYYY